MKMRPKTRSESGPGLDFRDSGSVRVTSRRELRIRRNLFLYALMYYAANGAALMEFCLNPKDSCFFCTSCTLDNTVEAASI